jgi:hypothetical protein
LRGEVFNALNHANFGTRQMWYLTARAVATANAGHITPVATDGRRIQIALKLNF